MGTSFNEQFDQLEQWRRAFAQRLQSLGEWLAGQDMLNSAVQENLQQLEAQIRSDKVTVAFVAEFSRGKSELINAIFFAGYGRRIMPASAGRTTMCPTELAWDAELPPSLRLLPIETRLQPQGLAEWRMIPQEWTEVPLDTEDASQLAEAFTRVSEVRKVTKDEARELGFWHDNIPEDNPMEDAAGMVEVPKWRHALINVPHPLLKQGLVILDTPGLNAVGAEPELTVNLLPQAQAIIFILGADTGVTRSDLTIWREHLISSAAHDSRLVVLNKIDTLWNPLNTPEQVAEQVERQRASSAEILGIPKSHVLAVSAQRGLLAKIGRDDKMLQDSGLPVLEKVLSDDIMERRQDILRASVADTISKLRSEAGQIINMRRRDLEDQMHDLSSLRGKNASIIASMRRRIVQDQQEFTQSTVRIQALRTMHARSLHNIFKLLSGATIKTEMAGLVERLSQPGLKLGAKSAYEETFSRLRKVLSQADQAGSDAFEMLDGTFRQLNTESGFSLRTPAKPDFARFLSDLNRIEKSHVQYLGVSNMLRLSEPEFVQRLVRALSSRLRMVFESTANDLELWSKAATAQLDVQLRQRKRSFAQRLDAIDRIQSAAHGLTDHIEELEWQEAGLIDLGAKLHDLTEQLVAPAENDAPAPTGEDDQERDAPDTVIPLSEVGQAVRKAALELDIDLNAL